MAPQARAWNGVEHLYSSAVQCRVEAEPYQSSGPQGQRCSGPPVVAQSGSIAAHTSFGANSLSTRAVISFAPYWSTNSSHLSATEPGR